MPTTTPEADVFLPSLDEEGYGDPFADGQAHAAVPVSPLVAVAGNTSLLYERAVSRSASATDRRSFVRQTLSENLAARGRFTSLPGEDDATDTVVATSASDAAIDRAFAAVGTLSPHERPTWADRLAGVLYDEGRADQQQRVLATLEAAASISRASR